MWEKIIEFSLGFLFDLVTFKYPIEIVTLLLGLAMVHGVMQYIALCCFRTKDSMSDGMSALLGALLSVFIVGTCRFILKIVQQAWTDLGIPTDSSDPVSLLILCMLMCLFSCFHLFIVAVVFREEAMRWNTDSFVVMFGLIALVNSVLLKMVYAAPDMSIAAYIVAGGVSALISTLWFSMHVWAKNKHLEISGEEGSGSQTKRNESVTI